MSLTTRRNFLRASTSAVSAGFLSLNFACRSTQQEDQPTVKTATQLASELLGEPTGYQDLNIGNATLGIPIFEGFTRIEGLDLDSKTLVLYHRDLGVEITSSMGVILDISKQLNGYTKSIIKQTLNGDSSNLQQIRDGIIDRFPGVVLGNEREVSGRYFDIGISNYYHTVRQDKQVAIVSLSQENPSIQNISFSPGVHPGGDYFNRIIFFKANSEAVFDNSAVENKLEADCYVSVTVDANTPEESNLAPALSEHIFANLRLGYAAVR